nr:ROK family protein [Novosphingobium sp. SG751A]
MFISHTFKRPDEDRLYGAIEAGGTKVNVAVGRSATDIVATDRIETGTPTATIEGILGFFEEYRVKILSFGVASFGPVRLDRTASDWGRLIATPKLGWTGASFVQPLIDAYAIPVELETDVSAAAIAEYQFGALRGSRCGIYLTVGTGIGGGIVIDGVPVRGNLHPEIGHIRISRGAADTGFSGSCPYHGDCLEGLASGPAIERRWGTSLDRLPEDHQAHRIIADYLGQACATLALTMSADRIVIGGGVSKVAGLHRAIANRMRYWLGGYLDGPTIRNDTFIVAPDLSDRAGITGALLLAQRADLPDR